MTPIILITVMISAVIARFFFKFLIIGSSLMLVAYLLATPSQKEEIDLVSKKVYNYNYENAFKDLSASIYGILDKTTLNPNNK